MLPSEICSAVKIQGCCLSIDGRTINALDIIRVIRLGLIPFVWTNAPDSVTMVTGIIISDPFRAMVKYNKATIIQFHPTLTLIRTFCLKIAPKVKKGSASQRKNNNSSTCLLLRLLLC